MITFWWCFFLSVVWRLGQIWFAYTETSQYWWKDAKSRPMLDTNSLETGGIFIVPHLLWHKASVSQVSSERPRQSSHLLPRARGGFFVSRIFKGIKRRHEAIVVILYDIFRGKKTRKFWSYVEDLFNTHASNLSRIVWYEQNSHTISIFWIFSGNAIKYL